MTVDKVELRRLAEECGKHGDNWYDSGNIEAFPEFKEDQDFVIAANPSTVLALLDELEAAQLGMKYSHAIRLKKTIEDLESERDAALAELEAYKSQLRALIHISDATNWEQHTCGEIAKARKLLEGKE